MNITNCRVLELTIISGESLTLAGKRLIKKNTYVVIKTETNNDHLFTTMDTENGSYPLWRQKFDVNMPMHATFFTLEVRCKNGSGDHHVGSARVPVSDFTRWCFPNGYLQFLSYRLRDGYGERNGIVNISVKVKSSGNVVSVGGSVATGWKYDGGKMRHGGGDRGVVIGVPYGY